MRLDPDAWLIGEPGDWNMWRRIAGLDPLIAHLPRPVVMHFREKTMIEDDPAMTEAELHGPAEVTVEDLAADVLGTNAARLLEITPRRRA
jgi:hypothetical protein